MLVPTALSMAASHTQNPSLKASSSLFLSRVLPRTLELQPRQRLHLPRRSIWTKKSNFLFNSLVAASALHTAAAFSRFNSLHVFSDPHFLTSRQLCYVVPSAPTTYTLNPALLLPPKIRLEMVALPDHSTKNDVKGAGVSSSTRLLATVKNNDGMTKETNIGPPLVDVDCNLLHSDMASLIDSSSISESLQIDGVDDAFKILHHPSTQLSNIVAMISPSSTIEESERNIQLLEPSTDHQRNNIFIKTTVGVHPYHALDAGLPGPETLGRLRTLLDNPNAKQFISCIGETGLDYSEGFPEKEHQLNWFKSQLDLAFEYNLPVFLHERLAFEDCLQCIDAAIEKHSGKSMPKIIVHCFTGSFEECLEYMKRGYYISVSGYINKAGEGSEEVKRCLREGIIPMDKFMIETDAPYLGFSKCRESFFKSEGESFNALPAKKKKQLFKNSYPNVPSALPLVLQAACEEFNKGRGERGEKLLTLDELACLTVNNAKIFFDIKGII